MRNQTYEQALTKHGLEWEYVESVPLADIDQQKSLRNQARLDTPVSEELIDAYTEADKEGYQFPAIVLWRPGKGKWLVVDGNHRLIVKIRSNQNAIDAYVIANNDPKVIDRLTWTFNNLVNGKRLSQEEAMQHAVSFVQKYGATLADATKEWKVPYAQLATRIRVNEGKETLQKHNIKITPVLTDDIIRDLVPLKTQGEDLFCKAAEVVAKSGATRDDVDELMRDVKRAKTAGEKIERVDKFASSDKIIIRKAETKGGQLRVRKNEPREKFQRLLKEVRNLVEDYDEKAIRPVSSDYKTSREMARSVVEKLIRMFGLGSIPVDPTEMKSEVG